MKDGLYAKFNTSKGDVLVNLEYQKTPGTVGNFVALAQGNLENSVKKQNFLSNLEIGRATRLNSSH